MGKTADFTVVQMMITDTLHNEGETEKAFTKKAGCLQSATVY